MTGSPPFVSVVVPCREEGAYIDRFVEHVMSQDYTGPFEVIVAEGLSRDGTRQRLDALCAQDSRIRVVDNPQGIVPVGLNIAVREAKGDVIVRMDVHTQYASDYLTACVRTLEKTGAANVGGPWRAAGDGFRQQVIAAAFQSAFSSGGARSHDTEFEGPVDSVYLGCWHRTELIQFGLFDEELVRNQDDELNLRIVRSGGVVWQSPDIRSSYFPRTSIRALYRQYFQYGYWKIRVIQKHRVPASVRHVVPAIALIVATVLALLAPFSKLALLILLGCVGCYTLASLIVSLGIAKQLDEWTSAMILPVVFIAFHLGYATGSLKGLFDFVLLRRGADENMATLTR